MTNILQSFTNLFTYIGYCRKALRVKSDFAKAVADWNAIGGFDASTEQLLTFLDDYSLTLVEYATWTETDLDDQAIAMIRFIVVDHRGTFEAMIDRLRSDQHLTTTEVMVMTETVCATSDKCGDPITVLSVLIAMYRMLVWLRQHKQPTPDTDTVPPDTTTPPNQNRPVINFVKKILSKQ